MDKYRVVGVMSGTSLDGADVTLCSYSLTDLGWEFQLEAAKTFAYPEIILEELKEAINLSALELAHLNNALSEYWSVCVSKLIGTSDVDFIAVHGQTVFHQPNEGLTLQLVNASLISKRLDLPVVSDFRSADVALGGQGAPLVPIGDLLLFSEYAACVNLGGFCNLSYLLGDRFYAFDVGVANLLLNKLASECGLLFDRDGQIAKEGRVHEDLLVSLGELTYFQKEPPKSLGVEWLENQFFLVWNELVQELSLGDRMATAAAHIADQLSRNLSKIHGDVLITGGGALNPFLMNELSLRLSSKVTIAKASQELIEFKEAIVFGFLGVLKWRNEINVLSAVTGANIDHSAGQIVYP